MSNYVSVIFCRTCGSRYVEIDQWDDGKTAVVHCRSCNARETLGKFTLGRCSIPNSELQRARDTRAHTDSYER